MIRVALDINVLVGGLLNAGNLPAQILSRIAQHKARLLVSEPLKQEIEAVFRYSKLTKILKKHGLSLKGIISTLDNLIGISAITPGQPQAGTVEEDPLKEILLDCAVQGKADFIVSEDPRLKALETYQGIKIVEPLRFLELM